MNRRLLGGLVLVLAMTWMLTIRSVGAASVLPVAGSDGSGRPAVGSCLTEQLNPVPCSMPHQWEVTASWPPSESASRTESKDEMCAALVTVYGNLTAISRIDEWTVPIAASAVAVRAHDDWRPGSPNWSACVLKPEWVDARSGSLREILSPSDAPELFGVCLNSSNGQRGVNCSTPHDRQVLGTTSGMRFFVGGAVDSFRAEAHVAIEPSCLRLGARLLNVADPTSTGELTVDIDIRLPAFDTARPGGVTYEATCALVPTGGRLLNATLIALGETPIPLQ